MAPYIPAARRRPRFSTASPDSVPSPAAMLAMIASSALYALLAPIILRQHVAQMNARDRDNRPTRNTAAGDAGGQVITAREADTMEQRTRWNASGRPGGGKARDG